MFLARSIARFNSDNIEQTVDFSFCALGGLLQPIQIREEFSAFLRVLQAKSPSVILEIGTASGGSLLCLCKLAPKDALIVSIDLPEGEFGGGYPEWKAEIFMMFKKPEQTLLLLRENSHQHETKLKVENILKGRKLDCLFIDGDHSYEGVTMDFAMYSPLVKSGGVIGVHDIAPAGTPEFTGGVPRFWKEVKTTRAHSEFVFDQKQTGYGIGCLFV